MPTVPSDPVADHPVQPGPVPHSPGRLAVAALPVAGFLATPVLPFVNGPHLWFGFPSVLVWAVLCTLGTVVALRLVEMSYRRAGGAERDAAEESAGAGEGDHR